MIVRKDILYPGPYHLPNGESGAFTRSDVRNACAAGNKMLRAAQYAAPLIWEHDIEAVPVPLTQLLSSVGDTRQWAANMARNTFGFIDGYDLEHVKGEPVLFGRHNIRRDEDAAQFERTRYVSCRVDRNWTDSSGRFWPGCIVGHVAATPKPIQMQQRPVMLSAVKPRPTWTTVFLSSEYKGNAVAEEKKGDEKPGGDAGNSWIGELVTELANAGLVIPEGVTDGPSILLALKTINANKAGGAGPDGIPGTSDDADDDPTTAPADTSAMPAMLSSMPVEMQPVLQVAIADKRDGLLNRLRRIERKVVERGIATVPQVRQVEQAIANISDTTMLSAMQAKKLPATRSVIVLESWEQAVGGKKAPDGKPPQTVNLSGTAPAGTTARPAPIIGPSPSQLEADIERARKDQGSRVSAKGADYDK